MPVLPPIIELAKDEAEARLFRVFAAAGCRTQEELAAFLDIKQSSISDAKKRKVVPSEWLMKLLRKRNVSPDWIMTGQGPRFMRAVEDIEESVKPESTAPPVVVQAVERRPAEDCTTDELMAEIARRVLKTIS